MLIIQLQQVGDTVIFSPALRALRERFPSCRVDVLANPVSAQLYAASPRVDGVVVAEGWNSLRGVRRLASMIGLIRRLRRERYDCVVNDVTGQSFAYALLAWLTGAPARAGFNIANRGFLHNIRIPFEPHLPYVLCNLMVARVLGAAADDPREEIAFLPADADSVAAMLYDAGLPKSASFAVIHPGSNWQSKTWYPERWAYIADAIVETHRLRVVFVGTDAERVDVDRARAAMRVDSVSLAGRTTLGQLVALIARAQVFVGTDSGPRNIAGALGVPNVVVMSAQEGTDRWLGVRPDESIARSDARCAGCYLACCAHRLCMRAIESDMVTRLVDDMFDGARSREPRQAKIEVPQEMYQQIAGTPEASCDTLRSLARRVVAVGNTT